MSNFNYQKYLSKVSINSDIKYHSEKEVSFLEINGLKCEISSLFLFALNVLLIYPDSFSYPIFLYITFQIIYGHWDFKKARAIESANEDIARKVYELLLPTLIYYDIEIKYGDYEKYQILIDELRNNPEENLKPLFVSPNHRAFELIKKAYALMGEYFPLNSQNAIVKKCEFDVNFCDTIVNCCERGGADSPKNGATFVNFCENDINGCENDVIFCEISGIISGIISEYPYFENLDIYEDAINYYQKVLKSQTRKKTRHKSRKNII